jgi:hypothetical protein
MALDSGSSSDAVISRPAVPAGVRIASTLAWVVGVLTIVGAVAIGVPALTGFDVTLVPFIVNLLAGIGVCAAAYLVRKQRRVGALLVVLAWALPTIMSLLSHQTPRGGNFLLFAAMLMLLANWKHLH